MTRAEVEDAQRRQRVRDGLEAEPAPRENKRMFQPKGGGNAEPAEDGSFPRSGARAPPSQP